MPELTIPSTDPNTHIHLSTQLEIPRHRLIDRKEAAGHLLSIKINVIEGGKISDNQDFAHVRKVVASTNVFYQQSPDKSIYGMNVRAILNNWMAERFDKIVHQTVSPWSMP